MDTGGSFNDQVSALFRRSLFHSPSFKKVLNLPVWGGSKSYISVETDPAQEFEFIKGFHTDPQTFVAGVPRDVETSAEVRELVQHAPIQSLDWPLGEAGQAEVTSDATTRQFEAEPSRGPTRQQRPVTIFLRDGSSESANSDARDVAAARCREARDRILARLIATSFLIPSARSYFTAASFAIQKQEDRWRGAAAISKKETLVFWLFVLLMETIVILPTVVSIKLGAEIAFLRSTPIELQSQLIVLSIVDYPWGDARLAISLARQCFVGIYPTLIFGLCSVASDRIRQDLLQGVGSIAWKAAISIVWQMLMHNGKNLYNLYYHIRLRRSKLTTFEQNELAALRHELKRYTTAIYEWLDTFALSNRMGSQISYYKQDHEDITNGINWLLRERSEQARGGEGKVFILLAVICIGSVICLSAFPVDPYAGLIALAYFAPLSVRIAVDVFDHSQGLSDVARVFANTAGPSFPSTVLMVINLIYFLHTKKALFDGFCSARLWIGFCLLFFAGLYPCIWGEVFMVLGRSLRKWCLCT
ncbi:hypothetical protein [Rhizobium leguminosarum]|uniref:C protein n=1 Tax=Rhizobium leguminosarum TaxID=384 RepID=A0A7K3VVZ6_RHILE|nr:hypothetical protein [Rhizobium leguminosarum]NEK20668.1 hypothetical protein [Rhizobium leguminosarum]